MDTLAAINARRSIRKYLSRPVEFEKITAIIDAGMKAPSAGNLQDWRFIIVTEQNLIKEIAGHSIEQYWIQTAPLIIVVCAVPERHEMYYGLRGKRLYTVQDCAASIENMLLAATELGLGSCWIGAFEEEKIRAVFDIPSDVRPQAVITLGYPDEIPQERMLMPASNIVYFNRYGMKVEKLHIVLRDYSVEWARQGGKLKQRWHSFKRRISEETKRISDKVKEKMKKK